MISNHGQRLSDAERQLYCSPRSISSRVSTAIDNSGYTESQVPSQPDAGGTSPGEMDWYGNTTLHHAFASNEVDMREAAKIIEHFPQYASQRNQFGRIPLHYALDRIRVHLSGLRLLLNVYPDGVTVADIDNMTPYDVARKWKHSRTIKKLLLDLAPSLDRNTHLLLTYGPLANLAIWASSITKVEGDGRGRVAHYDDTGKLNEEDDYVDGDDSAGEGGEEDDEISSFPDSSKQHGQRATDGSEERRLAAADNERILEIEDLSSK